MFIFIFSGNSSVQRGWKLLAVCLNFVLPSLECEHSLADFLADTAPELNDVRMRAASLGVLLSAQ